MRLEKKRGGEFYGIRKVQTKIEEVINMKIDWEAVKEAAKEPLRLLVLALIPFALAYFEVLPYEWATVIIFVLRFVDKYLHNMNKKGIAGGLTRF
jgi:hypothetical protein